MTCALVSLSTHVVLQQDEHAPLCQLFGRDKLVPGLSHLLLWRLPLSSPLVIKVQPTTVQLLQLVLINTQTQQLEILHSHLMSYVFLGT